jgi:hypothetical protein
MSLRAVRDEANDALLLGPGPRPKPVSPLRLAADHYRTAAAARGLGSHLSALEKEGPRRGGCGGIATGRLGKGRYAWLTGDQVPAVADAFAETPAHNRSERAGEASDLLPGGSPS